MLFRIQAQKCDFPNEDMYWDLCKQEDSELLIAAICFRRKVLDAFRLYNATVLLLILAYSLIGQFSENLVIMLH